MGRCACGTTINNDECACLLGSSDAVTITGTGAVEDPYIPTLVLDPDDGNTASVSAAGLLTNGMLIDTSAGRPGIVPTAGARVSLYETDTGLEWVWNGSAWVRRNAVGLLGIPGTRDSNYSNATTSFTTVVETPSIHVPDGERVLKITVTWPVAENPAGTFVLGVKRTLADGSSPATLQRWNGAGDSTSAVPGAQGFGAAYVVYEPAGLPEDDYKWQFVARSVAGIGGTTEIKCDSDFLATIAVEEV